MDNTIHETRDYDQFVLMNNNREQTQGHVERIKQSFEEVGNLTAVNPILVNEKMEIIDGQHRYLACKELGVPVFYTVREGLGINDARQMNILHRSWIADDYALSYANSGNESYKKYLKIREDYGFSHTVLLRYIQGGRKDKQMIVFRRGDLVIEDESLPIITERLDMLTEALGYLPNVTHGDRSFALALLNISNSRNYLNTRMMRKLAMYGMNMRRYGSVDEYARALEDIYNHGQQNDRVRLY
jgi:hypothetical protein